MHGRFITFEGGEGTGKSTQIRRLAARLHANSIDCVVTREPGGTVDAELIRDLLVTGEPDRWSPMSELCLINAARAEHVERVIKPALERGSWVLCDRYVDSTRVYQGFAKGLDQKLISAMHSISTGNLLPNLTIILDLTTVEALARTVDRASQEDRFESHDDLFHYRVADAFRLIARKGGRHRLIDGSGTEESVEQRIWTVILRWLDNIHRKKEKALAP